MKYFFFKKVKSKQKLIFFTSSPQNTMHYKTYWVLSSSQNIKKEKHPNYATEVAQKTPIL